MTLIRQVRQNASDVWPPSDLFWGSTLFKWKYWTQHYSRMDCEPWAPAFWCLYMVHVFDYVPIKEVYLTTSFWAQLNSGPLRDPPPLPWSNTLLRQSIPDFFSQFDLDAKDWHLQRLCSLRCPGLCALSLATNRDWSECTIGVVPDPMSTMYGPKTRRFTQGSVHHGMALSGDWRRLASLIHGNGSNVWLWHTIPRNTQRNDFYWLFSRNVSFAFRLSFSFHFYCFY